MYGLRRRKIADWATSLADLPQGLKPPILRIFPRLKPCPDENVIYGMASSWFLQSACWSRWPDWDTGSENPWVQANGAPLF